MSLLQGMGNGAFLSPQRRPGAFVAPDKTPAKDKFILRRMKALELKRNDEADEADEVASLPPPVFESTPKKRTASCFGDGSADWDEKKRVELLLLAPRRQVPVLSRYEGPCAAFRPLDFGGDDDDGRRSATPIAALG